MAGTAHLTQSKEGRYVLAGEIIAVGVAACSAGTARACSPAATEALQGALAGELSLGAIGGLSAAQNGGDISKGVLFGTVTGAFVGGLSGGTLAKFGVINPYTGVPILPSVGTSGPFVTGTVISGGLLGAGSGATKAYAGGRGNWEAIINGGSTGAIKGAISAPFTTYGSGLLFGGEGTALDLSWNAPDGLGGTTTIPLPIGSALKGVKSTLDGLLTEGITNSIEVQGFLLLDQKFFHN